MDLNKIKIVIRKEWAEVFKNRLVIFSIIFMPLLLTAIPLGTLYGIQGDSSTSSEMEELPSTFAQICPENLSSGECFQVYMVSNFMVMFMIIPLFIPVNIAAYSVVGEKNNRTLEPLLATPITTTELLMAKNLAAGIPAILATWFSFGLFAGGVLLIADSQAVVGALLRPMWLLAVFLVGPLMAVMSVNFSLMVSSRVNDPRVAEQFSALVILPVVGAFMAQMLGVLLLDETLVILFGAIILVLDFILIYLAIRLFERENILTRWK